MKINQLINAADASVSQTSVPLNLGDFRDYCITVSFSSATAAGTLKLQGSILTAGPYFDIPGSSQTVNGATTQDYGWDGHDAGYVFVKIVWTPSGGTGTLSANSAYKEEK